MATLCRNWRGGFAVQISLASSPRPQFVAGRFKIGCGGFPEAMAAPGRASEQYITPLGLASILISLGFNGEARWPAIARPGIPVAGQPLESIKWPITMSIFS
jgi:hypothetical protein